MTSNANKPRVWVIRGKSKRPEHLFDETGRFLSGGYTGISYGLDQTDLSSIGDQQELECRCRNVVSGKSKGPNTANLKRVGSFLFEIAEGDYVIMPLSDKGGTIRYGTVASAPYYATSGILRNRRRVEWSSDLLSSKSIFPLTGKYRVAVSEVTDEQKHLSIFLEAIGQND